MAELGNLDQAVRVAAEQLAAAERARDAGRDAYNDGLDEIEESLNSWATANGLPVEKTTRKNVVSLRIADVVTIDLGHYQDHFDGYVAINTAGAYFHAAGGQVPVQALTGFISGILGTDTYKSSTNDQD